MKTNQRKYPAVKDINFNDWCSKLECNDDELSFCIERVGTSWICVEAFWSMNKDRIRATFERRRLQTG